MSKRKSNPFQGNSMAEQVASNASNKTLAAVSQTLRAYEQKLALLEKNIMIRLVALEQTLSKTVEGITKDVLAESVADTEDMFDGFESVSSVLEGDRVRLEIAVKKKDSKTEVWGPVNRVSIDRIGSGATLGKDFESKILGQTKLKTLETDVDDKLQARVTINRISRPMAKESSNAKNAG